MPDRSPGTTAARSAATSGAGPSSARRPSTPTICVGPRPTSVPTRCGPRSSTGSPRSPVRRRSPTSCWTCTPAASWSASARSSSGSRETCGRLRSLPRCALPSSTRSCPPAGWRPVRAGPPHCVSRRGTSASRPGRSSASATRGSPSRTRSGWSAASSSDSKAARRGRSRPVSARTCAASARGRRPRSWRWPDRAGWRPSTTTRAPTAGPRRHPASGWSSASRPSDRASSGSRRPTTRPPGRSVARRPASCRSTHSPAPRCGRRRAGRRTRSKRRSVRSSPPCRARGASSSSSTEASKHRWRSSSGPRPPATGFSARASAMPTTRPHRSSSCCTRVAGCHRAPARAATSGSSRCRVAPATRTSSGRGACSRRPSASTVGRSRRATPPGR